MAKFRKKPVVIEAWQFKPARRHQPDWLTAAFNAGTVWYQGGDAPYITVQTIDGTMRAEPNDWIIRRPTGDLCPCKPEFFERIYEPVAEEAACPG